MAEVPAYQSFLWPTLQAVIALQGSASIADLEAAVIEREKLSPEVQGVPHGDGRRTEVQYRLAWARTYLKGMGLLTNSQRGVWSVTNSGQVVSEDELPKLRADYIAANRKPGPAKRTKKQQDHPGSDNDIDQFEVEAEYKWKDALLDILLEMSPKAFEKLSMRLLREAGVQGLVVTGGSGDKGIDGRGTYKMGLVSFPVFFQCKRYRGSVDPAAVRDFRGAMSGRGEKGILITTGTFTSSATAEAHRDGAPPVDLVDGDGLCELLREYGIGVRTTEAVSIEVDYFQSLTPN